MGSAIDYRKERKTVMKQITNNSSLTFNSIEAEKYRKYEWSDGSVVRIILPVALHVSKSGGHRIMDIEGVSHYIPAGWVHLTWETKDGHPAFLL